MEKTSHSTQRESERHDERESITRGAFVPDELLRQFDARIATKQAAQHGLTRGETQPAVRARPIDPAFGKEVG